MADYPASAGTFFRIRYATAERPWCEQEALVFEN
jgi:hypothetical protein